MTEKLYYKDTHLCEFAATVTDSYEKDGHYEIILDKSAFFSDKGGMAHDEGTIDSYKVISVREENGAIIHTLEKPIEKGAKVACRIDYKKRLSKMQNHSGEHIISGIVHNLYRGENVGFHSSENDITADFDVKLSNDDIRKIEFLANEAIYGNKKIYSFFPTPEKANNIIYRSKTEISEDLRLVVIEDVDICACCALHVSYTGEIGIIRIIDHFPHRGGTRIIAKCGICALEDILKVDECNRRAASLVSSERYETFIGVERILEDNQRLKHEITDLKRKNSDKIIENINEDLPIIFTDYGPDCAKYISQKGAEKSKICAVFSKENGNCRFFITSLSEDLKKGAKEFCDLVSGKGGGSKEMLQGSCPYDKEKIESAIKAVFK